jgi:hypothetical protein
MRVLNVAEKPSVARGIAAILSGQASRSVCDDDDDDGDDDDDDDGDEDDDDDNKDGDEDDDAVSLMHSAAPRAQQVQSD